MNDDSRKFHTYDMADVMSATARAIGKPWLFRRAKVWGAWTKAVGEQINAKSEPIGLKDDVLWVRVEDPAWAHELGYRKDEILEKMKRLLDVRPPSDIRFVSGSIRQPEVQTTPKIDLKGIRVSQKEVDRCIDEESFKKQPELEKVFRTLIKLHHKKRKLRIDEIG